MSSSARRSHYVVAIPTSLVRRVEMLEGGVNALRQVPEQVSAVAGDLGALRGDIMTLRGDVTQLQGDVTQLKRDMTGVRSALSDGHGGLIDVRAEFTAVRDEIRTGDEETRRQMRILHEEVISRIALLQEEQKTHRRAKR